MFSKFSIAFAIILSVCFTSTARADADVLKEVEQLTQAAIDANNREVQAELNAAEPPIQVDVCILKSHGSCGGGQSNCDTGRTCQDYESGGIINIRGCRCKDKPKSTAAAGGIADF